MKVGYRFANLKIATAVTIRLDRYKVQACVVLEFQFESHNNVLVP
jgi:hypothetical protein